MPIFKPFQKTTGTGAKRPKIKAKASENPNIDTSKAISDFQKSRMTKESKLLKANPSYTYLSLYHH